MFQIMKRMFQTLKYTFQALERKISKRFGKFFQGAQQIYL